MSEAKRGCGYRKVNGLYLVSDPGPALVCDGLPMKLEPCGCCGFAPPFSRNLQRIHPQYIIQAEQKIHDHTPERKKGKYPPCKCPPICPICNPDPEGIYGLMFVGSQYTPSSFIREAETMGISKRIPDIPHWLILGETWVFLASNKVPKVSLEELKQNGLLMKEPKTERAIFYGFRPKRLEMPVWKGALTNEEILILEKKGVTPVFLEKTKENLKKHGCAKSLKLLMKLLKPEPEEEPLD